MVPVPDSRAILGEGVRAKTRSSIFEGAVIGDRSVLEEEVIIKPDVKVWPQKVIEARTVVGDSVVWSEKVPRSIFTSRGIMGDMNGQLTPERLVRLGRAIGTLLPLDSRVVVGYDWSNAGRMAKQALEAGLVGSGLEIIDIGRVPATTLRFATRELKGQRGFHLTVNGENVLIRVVNRDGIDLTKSEERKIENLLNREEYRPVSTQRIEESKYLPDMTRAYLNNIVEALDLNLIARNQFRVAVGADHPRISEWTARLLDRLACDVIRIDRSERLPAANGEAEAMIDHLAIETSRTGANLGVYVDNGAKESALSHLKGRLSVTSTCWRITSLLFAESFGSVYLPSDAPWLLKGLPARWVKR